MSSSVPIGLNSEVSGVPRIDPGPFPEFEHQQLELAIALHDGLGGQLGGAAFRAKALADQIRLQCPALSPEAEALTAQIQSALDQVRDFTRRLAPDPAEFQELAESLRSVAAELENAFGTTCDLSLPESIPPLTPDQVRNLHFVALEAGRNAARHGLARRIRLVLEVTGREGRLRIANDGGSWTQVPHSRAEGSGLRFMEHRAQRLGGRIDLEPAPDGPLALTCTFPWVPPSRPPAWESDRTV